MIIDRYNKKNKTGIERKKEIEYIYIHIRRIEYRGITYF